MDIYQHFRPDEKEFVDQVLQWCQNVEETYTSRLTDFLDPREQFIVRSIIGSDREYQVRFFGGRNECERKRAYIFPEYMEPEQDDFQIKLFQLSYPEKFASLSHPEVLGSLTGLGLRRGKFGDILVKDKIVQFFLAAEVSDYIRMELKNVGRITAKPIEKPLSEALSVREEWQEIPVTVSSMRLDAVLSAASNLSRQKTALLISQGKIKVNWKLSEEPAFLLEKGDIISARGMGRIKIIDIGAKTRKGKWKLTLGKIK